jgi:hypothetical protein
MWHRRLTRQQVLDGRTK